MKKPYLGPWILELLLEFCSVDVLTEEPPPNDTKLVQLENVTVAIEVAEAVLGALKVELSATAVNAPMVPATGREEINEEGAIETKVETVDYRSPAGKENASVVHLTRKGPDSSGGHGGGVLAGASQALGKTLQSIKDAISGGAKDESKQ